MVRSCDENPRTIYKLGISGKLPAVLQFSGNESPAGASTVSIAGKPIINYPLYIGPFIAHGYKSSAFAIFMLFQTKTRCRSEQEH